MNVEDLRFGRVLAENVSNIMYPSTVSKRSQVIERIAPHRERIEHLQRRRIGAKKVAHRGCCVASMEADSSEPWHRRHVGSGHVEQQRRLMHFLLSKGSGPRAQPGRQIHATVCRTVVCVHCRGRVVASLIEHRARSVVSLAEAEQRFEQLATIPSTTTLDLRDVVRGRVHTLTGSRERVLDDAADRRRNAGTQALRLPLRIVLDSRRVSAASTRTGQGIVVTRCTDTDGRRFTWGRADRICEWFRIQSVKLKDYDIEG